MKDLHHLPLRLRWSYFPTFAEVFSVPEQSFDERGNVARFAYLLLKNSLAVTCGGSVVTKWVPMHRGKFF
jgi:hypothetical protein